MTADPTPEWAVREALRRTLNSDPIEVLARQIAANEKEVDRDQMLAREIAAAASKPKNHALYITGQRDHYLEVVTALAGIKRGRNDALALVAPQEVAGE